MTRLCIIIFSILAGAFCFFGLDTLAVSQNVVISQIQLGDDASVKNEFIQLYNNSDEDVDITGWCLYYVTTSQSSNKITCLNPETNSLRVFLPKKTTVLLVSNELKSSSVGMSGDYYFNSTLSGIGGNVRLQNSFGNEIDKVSWGVSTADNELASAPTNGSILSRVRINQEVLQDTDVSRADFEIVAPNEFYSFGFVYDIEDVCLNIDGLQLVAPENFVAEAGVCAQVKVDICLNMDGIQSVLPAGTVFDVNGNCVVRPLLITEILPNAVGSDVGGEFIEIYNPNQEMIALSEYLIFVGPNYTKSFSFPADEVVESGEYSAFYNDEIKYTLSNTYGSVRLNTIDGLFVYETDKYKDPLDGVGWNLLDDVWIYSNQLTPGFENKVSENVMSVESLATCPAGQERNPETGRCRKIISSNLVPCKDGQYRSEETNRCRSIVSEVKSLIECAEGQERNPATNRCRKIATTTDVELKPCPEGQERNPETNRCRKIVKMSSAEYKPKETVSKDVGVGWLALGGVLVLAMAYGIWEWRREIAKLLARLRLFIVRKK